MAITKIPAAGFTGNNFRNIIINGDMSIAQRSSSTASITSTGYHTLDRFKTSMGTAGTWTQTKSTDVPTGQGFANSLKMDCTTANGSLSAGSSLAIQQGIEGQNLQYLKKGTSSAESLTVSFWVKSNKTGTYIAELYDGDNSRQISKSYTISSADTWEKKTITYAGDTTGGLGNDNGESLSLNFWLVAGTNFTSGTLATSWQSYDATDRAVGIVNLADSTDNEWYITGVQLEAGTSASDFEFLPYDVNLKRCLRYFANIFSQSINRQGVVTSFFTSTRAFFRLPFLVEMRADPTVGTSNVVVTYAQNNATAQTSTFANTFPNKTSMSVEITGTYNTTYCGHVDNSSGTMTVDAEL
ncbi:putative carbohydrate binding domain containing protein [uncultured Mediterranean phage uvMED]|nr:putative carbohydrate binding domain containing protein [uncultured Mediterranean phage uvMED]